jgi:hypothetical protein
MRRIPGTNVFLPATLPSRYGGTRCATVTRFDLQNCVSAWVRLNYVSFLRTASRVSGCYSWPGCDFGACSSITTTATPARPFGDTGIVESLLISLSVTLIEALAKHVFCMCVSAWKVSILLCIHVTNQRKAEHEFNIDGYFDFVCTLPSDFISSSGSGTGSTQPREVN